MKCPDCNSELEHISEWLWVCFSCPYQLDDDERRLEYEKLLYNDLGMCGCGQPKKVEAMIISMLKVQKGYRENLKLNDKTAYLIAESKFTEILGTDKTEVLEFILHSFDRAGFLEHGGNVHGSWFTDKGNRFLELYSIKEVSPSDRQNTK